MHHIQSFIDSHFSLTWWKSSRKPSAHELDAQILNKALGLAVESNGRWLLSVQSRLSELYPDMGLQELDHYNEVCRDIIQTGRTLANQPDHQPRYRGILPMSRTQTQSWKNYTQGMQHHYPWISEPNLYAIYTFTRQGTLPETGSVIRTHACQFS